MITLDKFKEIALSFPETNEQPHFEKPSFRLGKSIFATYDSKNNLACLKLSEIDQSVFSAFNKEIIYPVPNKWGKQGWTLFDLAAVREDLFTDALTTAYYHLTLKNKRKT
ncbi:MmcQ/YjbR family DNA-binding protein [Pedobacter polaris]|uniref:MmcQ/YjbR family DNA-binding protein n=1 Tax=Pedobacter polaris TaxID=2571273 RepID=A0A4U1CEC7_9SPHI|nr:MmcQ/YjbR family DNA-binding protein [Pedobacter polaris]TKC05412.1 MmcQ/YjbR family DNA-binding protein [Pedobacter polaris]